MLTQQEIMEIATLPETAFRFKTRVETLINFYRFLVNEWTAKAITDHKAKYSLDCRTQNGKLKFAWYAAKELSLDSLSSSKETEISNQTATVKMLCQAIAFLNPVPQTNTLEKAPAYQIMGEPIYIDELLRNYKKLVTLWHPDNNPSPEAVGRFQLITQIYQQLKSEWFTKYSPLIEIERIGYENIQRAMLKNFPWTPQSFWD